jgi:DNA-binding NarL/FixJ family response regulator
MRMRWPMVAEGGEWAMSEIAAASDSSTLRIASVEDDGPLRREVAALLQAEPGFELVGVFANCELALRTLPDLRPDVVLMDINLPGLSGIEATRRLKKQLPATEIVMLTVFDDPGHIFEALKAGATGYVLKRSISSEIVAAIRNVRNGGSPMSSSIARRVVQHFNPRRASPEVATLTEREREVLEALSEGRQYTEIGDWLGMSVNTVRKHIRNIYEKLHVNSRADAVEKLGTR